MEAVSYLLTLPRFTDQGAAAYRPGLERMHRLMEGMGHPHRAFESVHVAGTNGKGSTASFLAAIGTAAGRRVGLHTSPHLFRLTERMRLDGAPAPEAWLEEAVHRFRGLFEAVGPSFFEATVALSFLYFAEAGVDLAVVEVGMGGRLDATNVLHPRLALITSIGLDHTEFLGTTLPEIAREKAGIIKPGTPVLTAAEQPAVIGVLESVARTREAPFHDLRQEVAVERLREEAAGLRLNVRTPVRAYPDLQLGLPGAHQQANALLALRAAELLLEEVRHDPAPARRGLQEVRALAGLRGRLERLRQEPVVLADVGHNPEGLASALRYVEALRRARPGRLYVLFGAMQDKDVPQMARLLATAGATVFPVRLEGTRALAAQDLATLLAAHGVSLAGPGRVEEGLAWFERAASPHDILLITGSHQVVAQVPETWFADR